jgi:hypothetical protein
VLGLLWWRILSSSVDLFAHSFLVHLPDICYGRSSMFFISKESAFRWYHRVLQRYHTYTMVSPACLIFSMYHVWNFTASEPENRLLWAPFLDAICLRRIRTSNSPLAFTYQVNISLIVNDDEAEQCVRSLHSAFFESDVSELDGKRVSDNGSAQLRSEE